MKHFFIQLLFLSISAFGFAQQGALSLEQCIELAMSNNLELKQTGLELEAAAIAWKQSKANLLPGINAAASHGINQGRSIDPFTNAYIDQRVNFASYGINAGLPLFNGLFIQQTIRQRSYALDASKMDLQQVKENLTLNVILAYLQALSNQDLLTISRNQVEVSRRQVERLEIMNRDGAISPSLLSDLQGEMAGNELMVIDNKAALETSRLALFQLMNVPFDENRQIQPIATDVLPADNLSGAEDIYNKAVEHLGLVKAADLRIRSANSAVHAAKGLLYPSLSVNGNINTNFSSAAMQQVFLNTTDQITNNYVMLNNIKTPVISPKTNYRDDRIGYQKQIGNNLYTTISLDLRIPLFNSLATRNRIRLAAIEVKNTEYVAESTRIQLRQTIEQAYVNRKAARDRYQTTLTQVDAFSASFKAAEARFNAGVGSVVDYIISKNNADRAGSNLIIARYDFILRSRILDYYQGAPLR